MHLLVTGGTGFFGKALLRYWISNPDVINVYERITILTRSPDSFVESYGYLLKNSKIIMHSGDIMLPRTLDEIPLVSHVLHAATDSTYGPNLSSLERYQQIVQGTENIIDFAVKKGVKKFLLTSSGGVYGPQPPDMENIPENYYGMPNPLDPTAAYSVGKRVAEHLCALYSAKFGFEFVVARCFAFVGQDLPLNVHFAIGNFIRDALYGNEIVVAGSGHPVRSYLHQDDLAKWLMVMLEKGKAGAAYNLGSDEAITIKDLAHLVRDLISPSKHIIIKGQTDVVDFKNRYVPSIEKIKSELGLSVEINLNSAILKSVSSIQDAL